MALTHFRGQVVDPKTGRPTKLFYDFVSQVDDAVADATDYIMVPVVESAGNSGSDPAAWVTPVVEVTSTEAVAAPVPITEPAANDPVAWQIQVVEPERSYVQSINTSITTCRSQTLICTAALTVTLNATPAQGEEVRVKATNGNVTIDAGSKTIDGASSHTISVTNESIQCVYSVVDDAWFIL